MVARERYFFKLFLTILSFCFLLLYEKKTWSTLIKLKVYVSWLFCSRAYLEAIADNNSFILVFGICFEVRLEENKFARNS
jgi:hypothetical protein